MITKAIYTYWTDNGNNYLCGFNNESDFKNIFKQSIEKSKQWFTSVICYTDLHGSNKLSELGIDIDVEVIDYSLYNFNKKFWNFPKLISYNLQNEPFAHIDVDLILNENPNLNADIVSEKQRGALILSMDYKFLSKDIYQYYKGSLSCSGLYGGNSYQSFKEMFNVASNIVNDNNMYVSFNKLVAIEEVLMTSIINRDNLSVQYLEESKYTHYQGPLKRNL